MIKFLLIVNEQGKKIFSNYYNEYVCASKSALEHEVSRRCLSRNNLECRFFDFQGMKIIYRHYGSVMVIVSVGEDDNELAVFEFINLFMETLDTYFDKVTESKIILNLDKVYMIIQEMVVNGQMVGMSIKRNLLPIYVLDRLSIK